jgi:transposase
MKTKKESITPVVRNKYSAQFKEQALERADRDGIPKVRAIALCCTRQ